MPTVIWLAITGAVLALLVAFFISCYKVVDPNEAHVVVVMGRGRKIYAPTMKEASSGGVEMRAKSAYFYIPILMKRFILPLTNRKMEVDSIHLNDVQVAPFICDVISWLHISDPIKAAERLDLAQPFTSLREDLINIVQAVARAVSMQSEILEIMKDRKKFSDDVSKEVGTVLENWGVELVNLEVNDIRDDSDKGSSVIADYESIRKAEISSLARQEIAKKNKEAVVVEQTNKKESEIATSEAAEAFEKREIEKQRVVEIAEQEKAMQVSKQKEAANAQEVEAKRRLDVGTADVEKEATIKLAEGEAEAIKIKGAKEAEVVELKGKAEGKAIEAKGLAQAISKDKMAEALKKFNDAATVIEQINAWKEVKIAMAEASGKVAENAEIKLVNSGQGADLFGIPMNAETGANFGQMLEAAKGMGIDLSSVGNVLKNLKEKSEGKSKEQSINKPLSKPPKEDDSLSF